MSIDTLMILFMNLSHNDSLAINSTVIFCKVLGMYPPFGVVMAAGFIFVESLGYVDSMMGQL